MANADNLLAAYLATQGLGWTHGTNLFDGPPKAQDPAGQIPGKACYCWMDGGFAPIDTKDAAASVRRQVVAVRVRGARDDYSSGRALAQDTWAKTREAPLTGYLSRGVLCETEPQYLGVTEDGRHEWQWRVSCATGA